MHSYKDGPTQAKWRDCWPRALTIQRIQEYLKTPRERESEDEWAQREEEDDAYIHDLLESPADLPVDTLEYHEVLQLLQLTRTYDGPLFLKPDDKLIPVPDKLSKWRQVAWGILKCICALLASNQSACHTDHALEDIQGGYNEDWTDETFSERLNVIMEHCIQGNTRL